MATATLTFPDKVKDELKRFSWVNWSEVARGEFIEKQRQIEQLERIERIISKSRLTQKQAERLADEINEKTAERHLKLLKGRM